jgi:hypothetical protein
MFLPEEEKKADEVFIVRNKKAAFNMDINSRNFIVSQLIDEEGEYFISVKSIFMNKCYDFMFYDSLKSKIFRFENILIHDGKIISRIPNDFIMGKVQLINSKSQIVEYQFYVNKAVNPIVRKYHK